MTKCPVEGEALPIQLGRAVVVPVSGLQDAGHEQRERPPALLTLGTSQWHYGLQPPAALAQLTCAPETPQRQRGAAAAVALVEAGHEGETYTLTGPEAITFEGVAGYLSEAVGGEIEYLNVPDEAVRQSMIEQGLPEFVAAQIVTVFGVLRQGAQERPTGTVQALTGHEPRAFADFARENARWFTPHATQQDEREKAS